MRVGQFLFFVLILLAVLATLGIVDWSLVSSWFKIMVGIFIAGFLLITFGFLLGNRAPQAARNNDPDHIKIEKDNSNRIGKVINMLIIFGGILAFIIIANNVL